VSDQTPTGENPADQTSTSQTPTSQTPASETTQPVPQRPATQQPEPQRPGTHQPATQPPDPHETSVTTRPISRVVPQEFRHEPDPVLRADRLTKTYRRRRVLDDVDLQVLPGQVCCLLGPAGAGKTTLLRCAIHLEQPSRGRVWIDGSLLGYRQVGSKLRPLSARHVAAQRRTIGFVADPPALFGTKTVLANVIEGPTQVGNTTKRTAIADATALLERLGIAALADAYPADLADADRVRVALARAMAMEPKVLLVDEPAARLPAPAAAELLRDLATTGPGIVVASRDPDFALRVADVAAVLDAGSLVESGKARDVLTEPAHKRTAAVLAALREQPR